MDTQTLQEIRKVKAVVAVLSDGDRFPGQDLGLVCQAAEDMLTDLETEGTLVELSYYIKRYCDVLDNPDDEATYLAAEIISHLTAVSEGEKCQYTQSHTRDWCGNPGCRESLAGVHEARVPRRGPGLVLICPSNCGRTAPGSPRPDDNQSPIPPQSKQPE